MTKTSRCRKLVHKLKYKNKPFIGVELGAILGKYLQNASLYSTIDAIIPVPLHPKRQKKRGYNQSEQIAIGIMRSFGKVTITNVLKKAKYNETQTKKNRNERFKNVENVFAINNPDLIENKHLLLVDDVITTGATIGACINAIQSKVKCRISVTSLAVASKGW
ncbi:MAG: ComF family protein [Bacteroidales bacterium]